MNRRSSLRTMAALLLMGASGSSVPAESLPIRRVMFEGARENESGLTLRFGTGIESVEFVFTGMKPLSIATAKKLSNLTGTDAGPDAIMAVITE